MYNNRYLRTYIDSCPKKSERRAEYSEQSTAHLNNHVKIIINSNIITPQKEEEGETIIFRKIVRKTVRSLSTKMRKIRVQFQAKQLKQK